MAIVMAYWRIRPLDPTTAHRIRIGLRLLGMMAWLLFALLCLIEIYGR